MVLNELDDVQMSDDVQVQVGERDVIQPIHSLLPPTFQHPAVRSLTEEARRLKMQAAGACMSV